MMWLMLNKSFQESGVHLTITNATDERWTRSCIFFFPTGSWGWGLEHNHYSHQNKRVCLAAFHTYRASPLEQGFIFWNTSGFKKVFYLKQDYYLNMFYCIFIAPLVLLQFSTSKRSLHHLHVDYTNMSDICNLIGLQLKKCF